MVFCVVMDELYEGKFNVRENVGVIFDNFSDVEFSSCVGIEVS